MTDWHSKALIGFGYDKNTKCVQMNPLRIACLKKGAFKLRLFQSCSVTCFQWVYCWLYLPSLFLRSEQSKASRKIEKLGGKMWIWVSSYSTGKRQVQPTFTKAQLPSLGWIQDLIPKCICYICISRVCIYLYLSALSKDRCSTCLWNLASKHFGVHSSL